MNNSEVCDLLKLYKVEKLEALDSICNSLKKFHHKKKSNETERFQRL